MTNNNLDHEIGLVTQFLNIWSDFERFSKRKEKCKSHVSDTLTESTDNRFSKRLKCLDTRDLDENLFIDYVGSYTVKKSSKGGGRTWNKQGRQTKRDESSSKVQENTRLDTKESDVKEDLVDNGPPLYESKEIISEDEETIAEDNNKIDIEEQTKSLLDFLKQHNILDAEEMDTEPPFIDISVPFSNDVDLLDINANEIEAPEANDHTEPPTEVMPFQVDDNNNPVIVHPVIIDITGSDSDSYFSSIGDDALEISRDIDDVAFGLIDYKHPLEFSWTFWYFTPNPGKSWRDNLEKVTTVSTVEDFWSVINWISVPSEMKVGADFSMFKEGIYPDWSDVHNEDGGRYVVKFTKEEIDEYWIEMLMSVIGQNVGEEDSIEKVKLKLLIS